jgi:hypothetical protein
MPYILLIAVAAILILQASGGIPLASGGGPLAIAAVFLIAALAVAIHEAWMKGRRLLGWLANIVIVLVGIFLAAPVAGMMVTLLVGQLFTMSTSLAATGRPPLAIALAVAMAANLLAARSALLVAERWR